MTLTRRIVIATAAGIIGFCGLGQPDRGAAPGLGQLSLVPQAHAIVGRPLTPVSVAGVARRTTRRTVRRRY